MIRLPTVIAVWSLALAAALIVLAVGDDGMAACQHSHSFSVCADALF